MKENNIETAKKFINDGNIHALGMARAMVEYANEVYAAHLTAPSIPEVSDVKTKEQILFRHWKAWMNKTYQHSEKVTFEDMKEDTSWLFFMDAMEEYGQHLLTSRQSRPEQKEGNKTETI